MNIFNVLSTGKSNLHEPSISAMFAYLLNPNQNHGLGRIVIDNFLKLANKDSIYNGFIDDKTIRFEIDLEVPYQYQNKRNDIDIQIKILDNSYEELHRIIIENKIKRSAANPKQLNLYYQAVINDENNDDAFELELNNLSVIFLTPKLNDKRLNAEFDKLETNNKVWLYWNSAEEGVDTIVKLIQNILNLEQEAKISPINEYMRHTLKAFTHYIIKTINISSGRNRVGVDIGELRSSKEIVIKSKAYTITLRDSGQIQLLNQDGDKVIARPLLRDFLKEHSIKAAYGDAATTRTLGKQIFDYFK